MQRFENKVAFITGGTNGMGLATAKWYIREGGKVIVTGRSQKTVDNALKILGTNAQGFKADAANMNEIHQLRQRIATYTTHVNFLFLNAGYGKFSSIADADELHFDELFDLHVKGPFFTVQQLLPLMQKGDSIVFNTSFVTEFGISNFSVYSAAKAAVASFIKTFASELADKGIRVNGVSPGHINTNIYSNTGLNDDAIEQTIESITPSIPFKRFGDADEIAKAVLFLASDDASYIHGTNLKVDAGISVVK
ncbi:SDR family oxidoreductase [Nubsella zeaxanthinifaciens]|uniref:SDR family oxidoreductase n=1 Tax=Nubsella zeaxanthinifaciens TaxID=392412 RepID=UPI003D00B6B8